MILLVAFLSFVLGALCMLMAIAFVLAKKEFRTKDAPLDPQTFRWAPWPGSYAYTRTYILGEYKVRVHSYADGSISVT